MQELKVSKKIYSKTAILKVAYDFQDNFNIVISEDEYNYILSVKSKNNDLSFNIEFFNNKLQEQELREKLNAQFGSLRNIIYEKAFEQFKR